MMMVSVLLLGLGSGVDEVTLAVLINGEVIVSGIVARMRIVLVC